MAALRALRALVELFIDLVQEQVLLGCWELSTIEQVLAETQGFCYLLRTSLCALERLASLWSFLGRKELDKRQDLLDLVCLVLLIKADGSRLGRAEQLLG